jgi:hypothetical protein
MKNRLGLYFFLLGFLLVLAQFSVRDFDDRYGRSINGDGKAYYAYLPAIFIYQQSDFAFIKDIEKKYYPEDGSQFKDFLNKQENGTYVNKTFPGLAVLYAPFFGLGYIASWMGGYDLDGYAAPFQWAIAFSHIFYFLAGLWFLMLLFKKFAIDNRLGFFIGFLLTFGTNCWYYLVYDHSVSHIHSFFLSSVLLYVMERYISTQKTEFLGWMGFLLSIIVITRPTNAVMVLFFPFLLHLKNKPWKEVVSFPMIFSKALIPYYLVSFIILIIPFMLWKWQTGSWVVYSYKDEGFDFMHPHFWEFLFSFQKGWLLWSPIIGIALFFAALFHFRQAIQQGMFYMLPILIATYILSSWWCWTYGTGFGQRPMIEFLPFIMLGFALALKAFKRLGISLLFIFAIPLCALSVFQGYQVANSILKGGETTASDYWSHFLQWKRDAPKVIIPENWQKLQSREIQNENDINAKHPYSEAIELTDALATHLVIHLKIGGRHGERDTRIVVSDADGEFYQTIFLGDFLYEAHRDMEFLIKLPGVISWPLKSYVWNGDQSAESRVLYFENTLFQARQ